MKKMRFFMLAIVLFSAVTIAKGLTPVEKYGQLSVSGNRIVDSNGNAVQLRGVSLFWSQWQGKYYNAKTVKWLVDDWQINVIRVAMAVEYNGYAKNPSEIDKVKVVIDAAVAAGIYVIVDFHVHEGEKYLQEAKTFFSSIAQEYGKYPNIIYEPWNEPVHQSWSEVIKPYHEKVIEVIRAHDPDNIIVCGTKTWSQDVDEAAADPLTGKNIAYALHYYAATHKETLRKKADNALNNGVALMVTEYGVCESSGNGYIDGEEARAWWDFMDQNKISHCAWSISDKDEAASALIPNASVEGGWSEAQITKSGKMVREEIRSKN